MRDDALKKYIEIEGLDPKVFRNITIYWYKFIFQDEAQFVEH